MQVSVLQSGLRALISKALRSKQEKNAGTGLQNRKHLKRTDASIASRCQTCPKPCAKPMLEGTWAPCGALLAISRSCSAPGHPRPLGILSRQWSPPLQASLVPFLVQDRKAGGTDRQGWALRWCCSVAGAEHLPQPHGIPCAGPPWLGGQLLG